MMPNGDPRDGLPYPILTIMSDSYSIDRVGVFIYRTDHSGSSHRWLLWRWKKYFHMSSRLGVK